MLPSQRSGGPANQPPSGTLFCRLLGGSGAHLTLGSAFVLPRATFTASTSCGPARQREREEPLAVLHWVFAAERKSFRMRPKIIQIVKKQKYVLRT